MIDRREGRRRSQCIGKTGAFPRKVAGSPLVLSVRGRHFLRRLRRFEPTAAHIPVVGPVRQVVGRVEVLLLHRDDHQHRVDDYLSRHHHSHPEVHPGSGVQFRHKRLLRAIEQEIAEMSQRYTI